MTPVNERLKETLAAARKDAAGFDIFRHMKEILDLVNLDGALIPEIGAWDNKVMVFEATDTGRSISINFAKTSCHGQLGARKDFRLKFEATEQTYLELLTGELDPDSAFFRRKIKIIGPIAEALKFKNIFFAKVLAR